MIRRRFLDLSVSGKLLSLSVIATATALLLASTAFVLTDHLSSKASLSRKLSTSAQIVATNATAAILFDDAGSARGTLGALDAEPSVRAAAIYDPRGQVFASYGREAAPPRLPTTWLAAGEAESRRFGPDALVVVRRMLSDGETIGYVYLEAETVELWEHLLGYLGLALAVISVAFLVAIAVSKRLQRAVTQPILELAAVARRVSADETYSVRVAEAGRDETGDLVRAFNAMLDTIEHREEALTAEIAERKVAQRELAIARDVAEAAREREERQRVAAEEAREREERARLSAEEAREREAKARLFAEEARTREEKARLAAEQASRLKSAFLANMSHEIRTPLNVILGYNSLIQSALDDLGDGSNASLVRGVERAGKRLVTTVHGILDISRIESGAFDVHPEPIRVGPFVARLVEDASVVARAKGLEMSFDVEGEDGTILFDEYCLSHAISNLLDNAIKFTDTGSVRVSLGRASDGGFRIEVCDTGVGIDAAYLPRLFEAFSQEQIGYTRQFEGAGLGLALAKRFLGVLGGDLSVKSEKAKGTTFTISIPPERVVGGGSVGDSGDIPSSVGRALADLADLDPGEGAKPCILVVEDDRATQELMRLILRERYRVLVAESAAEARRELATQGDRVRLVLMDLSLRGDEDGLALTRSLREGGRSSTIPIVAVTAHALSEDRENALRAGCDAYLSKPVERAKLLSVVNGFMR